MKALWPLGVCAAVAGCDNVFDLVQVQRHDSGAETSDDTISDASFDDGLIAWFPMDAVSTRIEELVAGHHGTCSTLACPTPTPGVRGGALAFDGTIQRVDVPPFAELQTSSGLTVSLWLRPDAFPPPTGYACAIVKRYTTVDNSWQICLNGMSNTVDMWLYSSLLTANWPPLGTWAHVVGVWDGSLFALFVDGAQIGTGSLSSVLFDDGTVVIGAGDSGGTIYPFAGAIDDVRIYNRPLTPAEVDALYLGT